mgnify:CR=1 FL=1|jgi:hypothetical protein
MKTGMETNQIKLDKEKLQLMLEDLKKTFNDRDIIECKRALNSIAKLGITIPKLKIIDQT